MKKTGTVTETHLWKIKIYSPPKEHGAPHVHVVSKGDKAEVKIYLDTFEVVGRTRFSRQAVKKIIKYLYNNYDCLIEHWEELHGKKK